MNSRVLNFIIFTISLFALGIMVTTLFNTNPSSQDVVAMFYASLFLTLFGIIFFIFWLITRLKTGVSPNPSTIKSILRLTAVSNILIMVLLFLASINVLTWANSIVLIVVAMISAILLKRRLL